MYVENKKKIFLSLPSECCATYGACIIFIETCSMKQRKQTHSSPKTDFREIPMKNSSYMYLVNRMGVYTFPRGRFLFYGFSLIPINQIETATTHRIRVKNKPNLTFKKFSLGVQLTT
jgi:hypothetical protein